MMDLCYYELEIWEWAEHKRAQKSDYRSESNYELWDNRKAKNEKSVGGVHKQKNTKQKLG